MLIYLNFFGYKIPLSKILLKFVKKRSRTIIHNKNKKEHKEEIELNSNYTMQQDIKNLINPSNYLD